MDKKDFAKIVRASDGSMVLFYVEPDDGNFKFHQVVSFDGAQGDLSFIFEDADEEKNERNAYAVLDAADQQKADAILGIFTKMIGG